MGIIEVERIYFYSIEVSCVFTECMLYVYISYVLVKKVKDFHHFIFDCLYVMQYCIP